MFGFVVVGDNRNNEKQRVSRKSRLVARSKEYLDVITFVLAKYVCINHTVRRKENRESCVVWCLVVCLWFVGGLLHIVKRVAKIIIIVFIT